MKEVVFKKCTKCKSFIRVIDDCDCEEDCEIKCCGEKMKTLIANTTDASFEKHIPIYEIKDDMIEISVNHVMEENHYIEWIMATTNDEEYIKFFNPGDIPKIIIKYKEGMILYSYCNKHLLWKNEVK